MDFRVLARMGLMTPLVDRWLSMRNFWTEYLGKAGASVKAYSVLRELPVGWDSVPVR
jgi:hypothetical protein